METVLVVGSTGNIGAAAVIAGLRSKGKVLAVVRNQDSANKLIKNVGTSKGITFVEADVTSDAGIAGVVIAFRDTIGYLIEQNHPTSTWIMCTGAQGDWATYPIPAIAQSALYPLTIAAARENESTNVRFNEIYLSFRVEVDADAVAHGVTKASDFAKVYETILTTPEIRGCRVRVETPDDLVKLRHQKKF
nr:hypothetical protein CFP56_74300 [Quercus suber]